MSCSPVSQKTGTDRGVALDRDSQVSKFSYGQFAVVEATDSQGKSQLRLVIHA